MTTLLVNERKVHLEVVGNMRGSRVWSGFSFPLYKNQDRKYLLAPPASGDTITASLYPGIFSRMYFDKRGFERRLSTGISNMPWN
jgi:hypothetical protein